MKTRSFEKAVAAVFILKEDGSCMLQHRDDKPGLVHAGKWTIPGGHVDPGESLEQCARRETEEETRYRCPELHLLATFDQDDGEGRVYRLSLFWTAYDGHQAFECLEGQALAFVGRQESEKLPILRFLYPYWDRALTELHTLTSP